MATETNWSCPICQNTRDSFCCALPCRHQFCLGWALLWWRQINPVCPLCRRTIDTVLFSDHREGGYLESPITVPEELPDAVSQAGRAPGHADETSSHPPVVSQPSSPQETPWQAWNNVLPKVWAGLFRQRRNLLDPVQSWLHLRMETMYGDQWWLAESTQSAILHALCVCGPDEEIMIQSLQAVLGEHTEPVVQGTINIFLGQCSETAQMLLRFCAAQNGVDNPADSSSCSSSSFSFNSCRFSSSSSSMSTASNSPTFSMEEDEAGTTGAAVCKSGSCSPPVSLPTEQDQPLEEPRQEVVTVAGPSAQGSSLSTSTPSQGKDSSAGGLQHPSKRSAPRCQDSPQPCKKPPMQDR